MMSTKYVLIKGPCPLGLPEMLTEALEGSMLCGY